MNWNNNHDFRYDLQLGNDAEGLAGQFLTGAKVEVKTDFQAYHTGNFFIEYESRGKASGIATTQADYYTLIACSPILRDKRRGPQRPEDILYSITIPVERLKEICREYISSTIGGGDNWSSKGILLPAAALLTYKAKAQC